MRIRPGPNLIRIVLVWAAISPLTFVLPQASWGLLMAAVPILASAVREYRLVQSMLAGVQVSRRQPTVVAQNVDFVSEFIIANQGQRDIVGVMRDVLPNVAIPDYQPQAFQVSARETTTIATHLRLPERGHYTCGPVWLRLQGPWRLLEGQQAYDCLAKIKVMPPTYVSRESLREDQRAQLLLLDKLSRTRHRGAGTEFESLSEYRPGDDPRRIDWRTTARLGHPIMRRYQVERHRDVMILIDCGRLMGARASTGSKLDCAIDAALMLAEVALKYGDRCGVSYFDDRVRGYRTPVAGVHSVHTLADSIYNLQSQWRESDFGAMFAELQLRQRRRSFIVLISDIVDSETTLRFRSSLARLGKQHVLLFAALRTPLLEQVLQSPASSLRDGSRQAVALELLRQRQQALHALRHGSMHVLDVEPSELTIPLINEFLELRCQNLL